MKITMMTKPIGDDLEETNEGEYSSDQLDVMLKQFVDMKKIEADPKMLAMLKDYALSKNKAIEDLFNINNLPKPKSLKELKKIGNQKAMESEDSSEEE